MVTLSDQGKVIFIIKFTFHFLSSLKKKKIHVSFPISLNKKYLYTAKVDISKLKSEIQMIEKSDFNVLKAENERLSSEIENLKQKLNEEVKKTQGGVRLDLNLERGRIKEELRELDASLKETHSKIESEIAGIRTHMETIKFQILQYMIGTLTGAGALILGKCRFFFFFFFLFY